MLALHGLLAVRAAAEPNPDRGRGQFNRIVNWIPLILKMLLIKLSYMSWIFPNIIVVPPSFLHQTNPNM
jgi:hypothetical protein